LVTSGEFKATIRSLNSARQNTFFLELKCMCLNWIL